MVKNKVGLTFGRLKVIEYYGKDKNDKAMWKCQCSCGKEKIVRGTDLVTGKTNSCGCLRKEICRSQGEKSIKHGMRGTRLYRIWQGAKQRCYYDKHIQYNNYGGKGIVMCDEWKNNFINFYNWSIQNGYADNLTLDRINVYGNYEPKNCRWVTYKKQENNRSNNFIIEFNNNNYTLSELSDEFHLSSSCLSWRIKHGWSKKEWNMKPNLANKNIRKEVV